MNTGTKTILFALSVASIGTAGFFLARKSKKQLRLGILRRVDNENDRIKMTAVVNRMTRQELLDTYRIMQYSESTPASVSKKLDPAFKARLIVISKKYNIFT